jgi:hypothetical protein
MSPARVHRIHRIRSRVIAAATALFVAVFGLIGVRLASGHDPALSTSASKKSTTSTSTSSTTSTSARTTSANDAQVTTSQQPSQAVAPVTTSQS